MFGVICLEKQLENNMLVSVEYKAFKKSEISSTFFWDIAFMLEVKKIA